MIDSNNIHFDKVYNKLIAIVEFKVRSLVKLRQLGKTVDYNTIKILNLYIRYLKSVKDSNYSYITVAGLNNISNFLNTL